MSSGAEERASIVVLCRQRALRHGNNAALLFAQRKDQDALSERAKSLAWNEAADMIEGGKHEQFLLNK